MLFAEKEKKNKKLARDSIFRYRYIPEYAELLSVIKDLKTSGQKIVLTQGVYDLFHVGHKRYLEAAKSYGDILIVGADSDELTKKRKGPKRPFDKLEDRVEILSGLKAVDIVTVRNEDDHMYKLIKLVQPDVLVMSQTTSDFTDRDKEKLSKYCGDIKVLPAKAATSTTAKLRQLMLDGVEQLGYKINATITDFLNVKDEKSGSILYSGNPQGTYRVLPKDKAGYSVRSGKKFSKGV